MSNAPPDHASAVAFVEGIARRLGVQPREMRATRPQPPAPKRAPLAPLDPDQFLRWAWLTGPRVDGTTPLTLDDIAFELGVDVEGLRHDYVRLSARVRRNQRLGLSPWTGLTLHNPSGRT